MTTIQIIGAGIAAWLLLNALVLAWAILRYRAVSRRADKLAAWRREDHAALAADMREAETERILAEAQLRDVRSTLAIERSRVDHLINLGVQAPRKAARNAEPFPAFAHDAAGARTMDAARRTIENRASANGANMVR